MESKQRQLRPNFDTLYVPVNKHRAGGLDQARQTDEIVENNTLHTSELNQRQKRLEHKQITCQGTWSQKDSLVNIAWLGIKFFVHHLLYGLHAAINCSLSRFRPMDRPRTLLSTITSLIMLSASVVLASSKNKTVSMFLS